jgi:quinone-modifying oxidoreductase subunit QmoC
MTAGDFMTRVFEYIPFFDWAHVHEGEHVIAQADFFSTWFVDLTFVPTALFVVIVFFLSLRRFIVDIHENAVQDGKTDKSSINYKEMFQALLRVIPVILKHQKFTECTTNRNRATPHMMVLYSFIGLFIVTTIGFIALYIFQNPAPYSQLTPMKWIANISGVALVIGSGLMIKNRMGNEDEKTAYKDWYILWVVFSLGLTGMLTEMARLAHLAGTSYFFYYLHLIAILNLFLFLPYSKMAHLVYRTTAMTYAEYSNRK